MSRSQRLIDAVCVIITSSCNVSSGFDKPSGLYRCTRTSQTMHPLTYTDLAAICFVRQGGISQLASVLVLATKEVDGNVKLKSLSQLKQAPTVALKNVQETGLTLSRGC